MCSRKGDVQVTSIESRGQPDAGWLAATKYRIKSQEKKEKTDTKSVNKTCPVTIKRQVKERSQVFQKMKRGRGKE